MGLTVNRQMAKKLTVKNEIFSPSTVEYVTSGKSYARDLVVLRCESGT